MRQEIVHKIMIQERCFLDLEGSIGFDNRDRLGSFNETVFNAINGLVRTIMGLIVGGKV